MDVKTLSVLLVIIIPVLTTAWKTSQEDRRASMRKGVHFHTKRHMMPAGGEGKSKRWHTTQKPREIRKKPSGHLKPLDEDDMENDEVVSVAVGPPPVRPKYDKIHWRHAKIQNNTITSSRVNETAASGLVKDVITQLGREFLTHQVSEDFVFGQYVGNAMKNLTSELRLRMQHEVLEMIVKYQKMNRGEIIKTEETTEKPFVPLIKEFKGEKRSAVNETDDNWPDFSNLAKIVG